MIYDTKVRYIIYFSLIIVFHVIFVGKIHMKMKKVHLVIDIVILIYVKRALIR